jgi:hypothetical protein
MPQLSTTRLQQVKDLLNESLFTLAGYHIETFPSDQQRIIKVTLLETTFYVELIYKQKTRTQAGPEDYDEAGQVRKHLIMTETPSDFIQTSTKTLQNFESFLTCLHAWSLRIKDEKLTVPRVRADFEEFQRELNEKLNQHVKDGDAHFSKGEKAELYKKLQALEERFSSQDGNDKEAKVRQKEVQNAVADLSRGVDTMPKRMWIRTAISKFASLSCKFFGSETGQKTLQDITGHFLK